MRLSIIVALSTICAFITIVVSGNDEVVERKASTVLIVMLIRNKAHTLPYFFSYLESLDYPKDRISLWFVENFPFESQL